MADRFQLRGGTAAEWAAANPVLASREPGVETDTRKWKVGDGTTLWAALPYTVEPVPAGAGYAYATPYQINAQTGTAYTPVGADAGKLITLTNAAAIAVTLPTDAAVTLPVGTALNFLGAGAGIASFAPAAGATLNGGTATLYARAQWSALTAIKTAANAWVLIGDLA